MFYINRYLFIGDNQRYYWVFDNSFYLNKKFCNIKINSKNVIKIYKYWKCIWWIFKYELATNKNNFNWKLIELYKWLILRFWKIYFFQKINYNTKEKNKIINNLISLNKNLKDKWEILINLLYNLKVKIYDLNILLYDIIDLKNMNSINNFKFDKNYFFETTKQKRLTKMWYLLTILNNDYLNNNFIVYERKIKIKNKFDNWIKIFPLKKNIYKIIFKFKKVLGKVKKEILKIKINNNKKEIQKVITNLMVENWLSKEKSILLIKIYKYIIENIKYNYWYSIKIINWKKKLKWKIFKNTSWIYTLLNKKGVCIWYSSLLFYLVDNFWINKKNNIIIWRWCDNNKCISHSWNKIWNLYFDSTYDTNDFNKIKISKLKNIKFNILNAKWFWKSLYLFSKTHIPSKFSVNINSFKNLDYVKENLLFYNYILKNYNSTIIYF